MNKYLQVLYSMNKGGDINARECAKINKALSIINIDDIPKKQLDNVKDYLTSSLNMNSVEPDLVKDLAKLLELL